MLNIRAWGGHHQHQLGTCLLWGGKHTAMPLLFCTCICFLRQIFRCECDITFNCQTNLFITIGIRFMHRLSFPFMICNCVVVNFQTSAIPYSLFYHVILYIFIQVLDHSVLISKAYIVCLIYELWSNFIYEDDDFRLWSITNCWTLEHEEGTISISWEPVSYGEVSIMLCHCNFVDVFDFGIKWCEGDILLWNC
jgi:hypothetical protein